MQKALDLTQMDSKDCIGCAKSSGLNTDGFQGLHWFINQSIISAFFVNDFGDEFTTTL